MLQGEYKKNYNGDYSKSYKNLAVWKKQNEIRRLDYEVVSKKLSETTYSKSERQAAYNIGSRPKESERVNSDGSSSRRIVKSYQEPVKRDWIEPKSRYEKSKEESVNQAATTPTYSAPTIETPLKEDVRKETYQQAKSTYTFPTTNTPAVEPVKEKAKEETPKYQPTAKEEPKRWKNAYEQQAQTVEVEDEIEDDGNYNYHDYPIEDIGQGKFNNLKTNKVMDLAEAKDVLKMAGFTPESTFGSLGSLLFAFIIFNIILPVVAPFVAIGYGVYKVSIARTTWQRGAGNNKMKYNMPASSAETAANKLVGGLCIVAGIIAAYIHYSKVL